MIYKVLVDGETLYVPGDQEAVIYSPVVDLAVGDAGQFVFELPEVNPLYDKLKNRQSMVQILKNGKEIFYGEVRTQKKDSLNMKQVTCVGALAFLFDSVQPQAEYHDLSPRQMLETWLNIHNRKVEKRKQIKIGIVTIHDSNDSLYRCTNQESTLECIRDKLVDRLGGVLRLRHEADGLYLDWITIEEYGKFCEQPIMFGENLMDYSETLDSTDLITACIPRGARLEKKEGDIQALEKYVDITSVNGGKDYVYVQEAVDRFGWVYGVVTWDDVTQPANLKKKAEEYIKDTQFESLVLELTAVDQSLADVNIDDIRLGDRIKVKAKPYRMNKTFPVYQMTIHLQAPEEDTFVIGSEGKMTYTQAVSKEQHDANMQTEENNRITTEWFQSAVDNLTQMMTGNEGGYKIEEFDEENRWLRTLIMDAPRKEDAKNLLQFNKYGIGGSHNGFNGPYTVGMTISGDLIGERLLAGSVKAEALSAEYKSSVSDEIDTTVTAKFEVAENLISAEVKRAKDAEEELSSSLKLTSEMIETKVSKDGFGSYVQQYYDHILLGFNTSSKYVQITAGAISIYNNGVEQSKKRSMFDQNGNHFYRDGYYVGMIGTAEWDENTAHKGLVFDLDVQGKYMAWAYKKDASAEIYKTIWSFEREGTMTNEFGLHAGCSINMHNWTISNAKLQNVSAGGKRGWSGSIPIVTKIEDAGDGAIRWYFNTIDVIDGIIVSAPRQ